MAEGDVDLGAFLDKYSPTPEPQLPERKAARTTYYYPATPEATAAAGLSYKMEGGIHGAGQFSGVDLREHTLEKFQQGKTDWVAVAMEGVPTGEKFRTTADGKPIIARNVDTGGGLKPGQHDIATEDPQKAKTGGEGGGAAQIPGISPMMQIAMEEPPAKAAPQETPQAAPSSGGAGFTPTPAPQFTAGPPVQLPKIPQDSGMTPTPPIPTTPQDIDLGAFLASRQTPTPTPVPAETPAAAPQDIDLGQFLASRVSPHELPQAGAMAPVSKLGTAVGEFAKSQLPEVMPSLQSQVVGMMPPPVQMAVSGVALGRENYEALQQPIGSQAQYNVAVKDVASLLPLVAPAVSRLVGRRTVSPGLKAPPAQKPPPGGRQVAVARTATNPMDVEVRLRQQALKKSGTVQQPQPEITPENIGYTAAVKSTDGKVFTGESHETAITNMQNAGSTTLAPNGRGFVSPDGRYMTLLEVAREEQTKQAAAEPPTTPPVEPADFEPLTPVPGSGKFRRSYRVDKELGDRMEGIGASRESGALRAELQSRNMLHELSPAQEADLGRYLVSRRLKTLNPDHPQILPESEMTRIENDPAIKKALDYYKEEIKPEVEDLRKRAGLSEEAAKGKEPEFISLIVKNPEPLPPARGVGLAGAVRLPRKTRFAQQALGMASEYSTNLREILSESYGEVMRKMRVREFYDATKTKGITENGTYDELPAELQHDLTAATQPELNRLPIQSNPNFGFGAKLGDLARAAGKGYQKTATGFALTANPPELLNHMRRQLNLVAAKPPVGMGVMARLEVMVPYFGPKLGAFKRAVMEDMNNPRNQEILQEIFDAGGGSTRSFGERYAPNLKRAIPKFLYKWTGLKWLHAKTQSLLFAVPEGRGVKGWDLRMRVQMEKIRRAAEGDKDPQRMREFANQIGQYGSHPDWFVRGLRVINPYAATTVPMRLTELKTAVGTSGLKGQGIPKSLLWRAETTLRGTGGTLLALATANYALSGKWPWQNDAGHEFDLNTGVKNKDGKTVYVKLRAIAPELSRPVNTLSIPDVARERTAKHPQYLAAAATGPSNQVAALLSGPGQNVALTAATGKVPYFLKRPGEGVEVMDVATLKKGEAAAGASRGLRQFTAAAKGVNPLGGIFGSEFNVEVPDALHYIEEPIPGVKPFGDIYTQSYEKKHGGHGTPVYIGK